MVRDYTINIAIREFISGTSRKSTAVADKAGIRRDTFSRIIRCKRPIYADEIMPICDAMGVTIEELFRNVTIQQKAVGQ